MSRLIRAVCRLAAMSGLVLGATASLAGGNGLGGTGGIYGGPVACNVDYVQILYGMNLEASDSCANGTGNNDFLNPLAVNEQALFGHEDWVFLSKAEATNTPSGPLALNVTGIGGISGTWSVLDDMLSGYADVMIVLKAGTEWAGFLIQDTDTSSGTWGYLTTPGLSHLSLYARGYVPPDDDDDDDDDDDVDVPEPAALGLLGLGLAALMMRRRRA